MSVTDADGDQVLMAVPLQALHYSLASEQAIAIVLWVCCGFRRNSNNDHHSQSSQYGAICRHWRASYSPVT